MITRTEDTSFDTDYDIFSLAGRAALIGGGIYAINQSIDEGIFKRKLDNTFKSRKNTHIQALKETIKNDIQANKQERTVRDYAFKKNNFFDFAENQERKFVRTSFDNIGDRLPKGYASKYNKNSSSLLDELEELHQTVIAHGGNPIEYYVGYGEDKMINHIQIKTDAGKFDVHVVDNEGMIKMGDNKYVARNYYTHAGNDLKEIFGSDVGTVRFIRENYGKLKNKEISINEMRHRFQESLYYSDKNFGSLLVGEKANPLLINTMRSSAIQNPYASIVNKQMGRSTFQRFKKKQSEKGRASGSASDINKGILHLEDAPFYKIPFLDITSNPKQLFRNIKHKTFDDKEEFISNVQALFLKDEDMNLLKEELANRGINIGELAAEELLVNKAKAGKIINSNRSISVNSEYASDFSDYLLNKMSEVAGFENPEKFSLAIKEKGFESFSKETQEKLRKISLDDYKVHLETELAKSRKKSQAYLSVNKSLDHTGGDLETRLYYSEAEKLKKEGKLEEAINQLNNEIDNRGQQLRDRNIFGKNVDGEIVALDNAYEGLFIDDLHYSSKKELTYRLRRENRLGVGDKIHDPSGELKALIKGEVDDLPGVLEAVYKRKHNVTDVPEHIKSYFKKVHFIANDAQLKNRTVTSRNAYSVLKGISEEAGLKGNQKVNDILSSFQKNYDKMDGEARLKVWHDLEAVAREQGTTLHDLSGFETGIGFSTSKMVAYGESAIDMGAGGLGFFSERHIKMFEAMGMKHFVSDIMNRRVNKGVGRTYADFKMATDLLRDTKYQGHFNLDDLDSNFMENVFPLLGKEEGSVFKFRQNYLNGKIEHGATFVNLGEEIGGINKIAIFSSEDLRGYLGHQIGSKGTYQKYVELEQITRNILEEAKTRKDPKKLESLIKNYTTAIGQMDNSLSKKILGDKVVKSLYGQVTSGGIGLKEYAEQLAKTHGTKTALPFVATVSDKKFIEMYGKDSLERFKKNGISDAWAMATREPYEGLSSVPVNVVPESAFKDISSLGNERIGVITEAKNNILKMLFGDTDGDSLSLIPGTTGKSAEQIRELAIGNSPEAIAFREAQKMKTEMSLKGRKQKSILEMSFSEIRDSVFYAKDLEKHFVGIASNAMKPLHELNALKHGNGLDPEKFYKIENSLHIFAENVIKGKHQTLEELKSGKAQRVLDALTGIESFKDASLTDRIKFFREYSDDIFLGDAAHIGSRIRAGENSDEIKKILDEAGVNHNVLEDNSWYKQMTSDDFMNSIMETADLSKDVKGNIDEATRLAREEVFNTVTESARKRKELIESIAVDSQEFEKMFKGAGAKVFKYAIAPAAVIGLLGTVFHSRSTLNASGETSDNKKNVYVKGGSVNMNNPKYMKPEVQGTASGGFSINKYSAGRSGGDITINDHTRNFNYYDMQDKINRGY